jgi:hypothetical protein
MKTCKICVEKKNVSVAYMRKIDGLRAWVRSKISADLMSHATNFLCVYIFFCTIFLSITLKLELKSRGILQSDYFVWYALKVAYQSINCIIVGLVCSRSRWSLSYHMTQKKHNTRKFCASCAIFFNIQPLNVCGFVDAIA